jgi:streptogrisin D
MIVTVTNPAAAGQVRAAGLTPKLVTRGAAPLHAVTTALDANARVPGSSWAVDPRTDQVVVSVDPSVTGAALARITAVTHPYGPAVRITRRAGLLDTDIEGGQAIYSRDGGVCSLGFTVHRTVRGEKLYFFLTAGHCAEMPGTFYEKADNSVELGKVSHYYFPKVDYALVRYTGHASHPSSVSLYGGGTQPITKAAKAYIGESVTSSGRTTHVQSGQVVALDVTVNYRGGATVHGLIETNSCGAKGDSGGPLFDGKTALGLMSGGSGDCAHEHASDFQPVLEPLGVYGMTI